MKKLLFLLLLFPMFLFSQTKIVLKGTQVTISSLANIAGLSVVANATGSPATPTAVLLGVGLTFSGGKLAIDTAHFKDSIYALNGLQILGVGYNRIGLGGFLSQNTTISGSNLYAFTLDSMQAAVGRGFRVNFGSDAGWDLPVRDSATGFWTRIGKGTVGQALIMLPGGGIGWGSAGTTQVTSRQAATAAGGVTTFTFTSVPASFNDYQIFVNGILIIPTTDYTTAGNVVTISGVIDGDKVVFWRIK
jgi:hypothetical protein